MGNLLEGSRGQKHGTGKKIERYKNSGAKIAGVA
jgi:hypothetical protein